MRGARRSLAMALAVCAWLAAPAAHAARPTSERADPVGESLGRFDGDGFEIYGWRLRLQSAARGIYARDVILPGRGEFLLRHRLRADATFFDKLDLRADGRVNLRYRRDRANRDDVVVDGELSEAWLRLRDPFGLDGAFVQLGRMRLRDDRSYLWDEDIEALRAGFRSSLWSGFAGYGGRLSQGNIEDDGRRDLLRDFGWFFAELRHQWRYEQTLEARVLQQRDFGGNPSLGEFSERFASNEDLLWLSGRAAGRIGRGGGPEALRYWLDVSWLGGDELRLTRDAAQRVTGRRSGSVSEWAFDLGASLELDLSWRTAFTVSYAAGSERFRQPLLARNRAPFTGPVRFRRLGEVLRPGLSNLHVLTLAVGTEVGPQIWLETVFHRYWQDEASSFLVDDALVEQPLGSDRDLGWAVDVVAGLQLAQRWQYVMAYGVFVAGDAFGAREGKAAHRLTLFLRKEWP